MRFILLSLLLVSFSGVADEHSDYISGIDAGCTASGVTVNQISKVELEKRSSAYRKGWDEGFKQCEQEKLKAKAGIK